jgi:hypothetical protein
MRNAMKRIAVTAAVLLIGAIGQSRADQVTIATGDAGGLTIGDTFDKVLLSAGSQTYDIPGSMSVSFQLSLFHEGAAGNAVELIHFNLTDDITINGELKSITLSMTDSVSPFAHILTIDAGPTVSFGNGNILFTPQQVIVPNGYEGETSPFYLRALVTVAPLSAVPEPSSLVLGCLAIPAVIAYAWRRRTRRLTRVLADSAAPAAA